MRAVGLLSPGDMGHAVARVLIGEGMPVLTNLTGRSERTRERARSSGIDEVRSHEELVRDTDVILSIVAPAEARNVAREVARALEKTGAGTTFVDCNAVSPETAAEISEVVGDAGGGFVDASIIGPPPRGDGTTRFYASGPRADVFAGLGEFGLDVRVLGGQVGRASGLKMAYAAFTKGTAALTTELLVAARAMGLYDDLVEELRLSQPEGYGGMVSAVPTVPKKARRWVGEMEEIARTFAKLGLTPKVHEGAAEVFRFVDASSLDDKTFETSDRERILRETVEALADSLAPGGPDARENDKRT